MKVFTQADFAPDPRLARSLWQWLAVGVVLVLVFPQARGVHEWLGSGPFWLLGAPLVSLLTAYRHALAAAWRGVLVPAPRRRRPSGPGRQARRTGFGGASAHRRLRAA